MGLGHPTHEIIKCRGPIAAFNTDPAGLTQTTYTQTYDTASATVAAATTVDVTLADGVGTNDGAIPAITNNASTIVAVQELAAAINTLKTDLISVKQNLNKVVDDLQKFGLGL